MFPIVLVKRLVVGSVSEWQLPKFQKEKVKIQRVHAIALSAHIR